MRCINVKECQLCVNFHSSLATHKLCELKWSRRQKRAIDKCVLTNTTAYRIYTTNMHWIDEVFFLRNWNISYLLAVSVGKCVCDRPPRIQFHSPISYMIVSVELGRSNTYSFDFSFVLMQRHYYSQLSNATRLILISSASSHLSSLHPDR